MAELVTLTNEISNDFICNYFYFWFIFTTITVALGTLMYIPLIPKTPITAMIGMLMSVLLGGIMALQPLAMYLLCKRGVTAESFLS